MIPHIFHGGRGGIAEDMIYIIRAKGTGMVKIGFTKKKAGINKRLRSIQTGCPHELKLLGYMPGSKRKERCMHILCRNRKAVGEWFKLSDDECRRMLRKFHDWSPSQSNIERVPHLKAHSHLLTTKAERKAQYARKQMEYFLGGNGESNPKP